MKIYTTAVALALFCLTLFARCRPGRRKPDQDACMQDAMIDLRTIHPGSRARGAHACSPIAAASRPRAAPR